MSLSSRLNPNRGNLHAQTLFLISPIAFSRAIGDFSVAVLFMVRPNLPMAIFKKIKVGGHHEKKVIYQITRHKISKIERTSEKEERAVAEANRDFERIDKGSIKRLRIILQTGNTISCPNRTCKNSCRATVGSSSGCTTMTGTVFRTMSATRPR